MEEKTTRKIRFRKAHASAKFKEGGIVVVSEALVKKGVTNIRPKVHVKRGDTVVLISGPRKDDKKRSAEDTRTLAERNAFRGTIGKVIKVNPSAGKIIVEGVNMVCHFLSGKKQQGQSGVVRKEAALHASKVMLWDTQKKRPLRSSKRKELEQG